MEDFLCFENLDVVLLQETKMESCDRRFVGSVWKVRNNQWIVLPTSKMSGNIF